jgi:hypothetical protein
MTSRKLLHLLLGMCVLINVRVTYTLNMGSRTW